MRWRRVNIDRIRLDRRVEGAAAVDSNELCPKCWQNAALGEGSRLTFVGWRFRSLSEGLTVKHSLDKMFRRNIQ